MSLMTFWQLCKAHGVQQTAVVSNALPSKIHRAASSTVARPGYQEFYQRLVNISSFGYRGMLSESTFDIHLAYNTPHGFPINKSSCRKPPKKTAQFLARGRLHPWEAALYMFPYRGARWDFLTPSMTIRSIRLGKPWMEWRHQCQVIGVSRDGEKKTQNHQKRKSFLIKTLKGLQLAAIRLL